MYLLTGVSFLRERIGGTDSRRADFDESRLAEEYDPTYLGDGKLGKYQVHKLKLKVKGGKDVPWPIIERDPPWATCWAITLPACATRCATCGSRTTNCWPTGRPCGPSAWRRPGC